MTRATDRAEVLAALERHAESRSKMDWLAFGELFEVDANYFDSIHGWSRGREEILEFLRRTMRNSGPWLFLENWRVVDPERAVFHWTQRYSEPKPAGGWWQFEGVTTLRYGSHGRWIEQRDIYDTAEAKQVLHDWAVAQRDAAARHDNGSNRGE